MTSPAYETGCGTQTSETGGLLRCRYSANGAHRCILSKEHADPSDPQGPDHLCLCGVVFSPAREYGQVVVTKSSLVVDRADPLALLALEALRQMRDDVWCSADRIYVGNTPDGEEVIYQIVGWDAERKALIIQRIPGSPAGPVGLIPTTTGLVCRSCVRGGCTAHPGDVHGYGGEPRD